MKALICLTTVGGKSARSISMTLKPSLLAAVAVIAGLAAANAQSSSPSPRPSDRPSTGMSNVSPETHCRDAAGQVKLKSAMQGRGSTTTGGSTGGATGTTSPDTGPTTSGSARGQAINLPNC
jgi:hypothetical protein